MSEINNLFIEKLKLWHLMNDDYEECTNEPIVLLVSVYSYQLIIDMFTRNEAILKKHKRFLMDLIDLNHPEMDIYVDDIFTRIYSEFDKKSNYFLENLSGKYLVFYNDSIRRWDDYDTTT